MNDALLKRLTEATGVPGQEDAIRAIVREELGDLCEYRTDYLGNLIATKPATIKGDGPAKRLMIAAHMDEIGFMVKFIDDKGFLRLNPLGGWDPRVLTSQRVIVHTAEGPLGGVMSTSTKPKHLQTPADASLAPTVDQTFIDLGMDAETARSRVRLGDMVTLDRGYLQMGDLCTSKAMDDRVALYVMIEALRAVKDHSVDVVAVATTQEEIGLRGATASGWSVEPDMVVAIDVTLANDIPGLPDVDMITKLGGGAAIKIMDGSLVCHPKMVAHFRDLAEAKSIPYQMEILTFGGTDAGGIQRLHGGIPAFTLSVPCRYVHTPNETVHRNDVDACVALMAAYIEAAHEGDYTYQ